MKNYDEMIKKEIDFQLSEVGFFNESDNTERFSMQIQERIIAEDFEKFNDDEDLQNDLLEHIENYIKENCKGINACNDSGNYTCYYYKEDLNFEDVKELEKHFLIGE